MLSRRHFLRNSGRLALAGWASCRWGAGAPGVLANPVGYATIAWPDHQLDQALETISSLGFRGVQLLGWVRETYGGAKTDQLKERLRSLKLQPVALSCWGLELHPHEAGNEVEELRSYAAFWQRMGGAYLQVTDGGRPNRSYSRQEIEPLGRRMTELGKLAQDFGLTLGYHPHFDTMGETREGLGRVLDATDPRYVKLIADVGHLTLGGADPVEVIRSYHDRLIYLHFKDVRKDVAELVGRGRELVSRREFRFCEVGGGVVDFPSIVQALSKVHFSGWIIVELDGNEPAPGGPAASTRKNKEAIQRLGLDI